MVIAKVFSKKGSQMFVVKDDHVVQALASNAADQCSTKQFCQGLLGVIKISSMLIPSTLALKDSP